MPQSFFPSIRPCPPWANLFHFQNPFVRPWQVRFNLKKPLRRPRKRVFVFEEPCAACASGLFFHFALAYRAQGISFSDSCLRSLCKTIFSRKHLCTTFASPFLIYFIINCAFMLRVSYKFAIFAPVFRKEAGSIITELPHRRRNEPNNIH